MPMQMAGNWLTLDTANSDFWSDQSYTVRVADIKSVRLVKAIVKPNGPDNGVEIKTATDRFWMRYQDYAAAEADYKAIQLSLMDAG